MEFPKEMMHDSVWFDRTKYQQDREHYELFLTNNLSCQLAEKHAGQSTKVAAQSKSSSALTSEIAKARESIKQSLAASAAPPPPSQLEMENLELKKTIDELVQRLNALESRVTTLEGGKAAPALAVKQEVKPAAKDESGDEDLFGSDSESEDEAEKQKKADRVAAYQAKKATKKVVIAKSMVIFDVKPWEDTTDLKTMEGLIRKIEMDGLIWGQQAKTVPIAYGIKKLQISAVVEDLKVSTDELSEKICDLEDYVQSVDIAAFNKL